MVVGNCDSALKGHKENFTPVPPRQPGSGHSLALERLSCKPEATETPSGNNDPSGRRFWALVLGA